MSALTDALSGVDFIVHVVLKVFAAIAYIKFSWRAFRSKKDGDYSEALYTMSKAIVMFIAALHL